MNSSKVVAAAGIQLIGPRLTSKVSAETLKKKNEKLPSLVSYLLLKYGWQTDHLYRKLIGPPETLKKKKGKKGKQQQVVHSLVSYLLLKFDRPRYERQYGWQASDLHRKFELDSTSIPKSTTARKLEDSDFFYVDDEPRSSIYQISKFYRVYPYYELEDTTQIIKQKNILHQCCIVALRTHNLRTDDHLKFDKLVSANMLDKGFPVYYFITFKAYIEVQSSREYKTRVLYVKNPDDGRFSKPVINIQTFTVCQES